MTIMRINRAGTGKRDQHSQRGSTIMLVTMILATMGIIALFLIYRVDAERLTAINMEQRRRFQQTAEAVLQRYLGLLIADDKPELDTQKDDWYAGGRVEYQENGYIITVLIEDEGSKPNLNLQESEGLRYLLPLDPIISIDTLLDWLDPDNDLRGEKSAELDYYQGLTPPYKPRNGFMASVDEMKAIKDSEKFYSYIAPEVTVFGKINPNVLDRSMFEAFLFAIGLDKKNSASSKWVGDRGEDFYQYRFVNRNRFNEIKNVMDISSYFFQSDIDVISPYLKFKGNCNLNFVDKLGLKMMIRQIGLQMGRLGFQVDLNPDLAEGIINYRNNQPFESLDSLFKNTISGENEIYAPINIGDFFTLVSTLIRYRIWVAKGSGKYYLETIQEREPVKGIRNWELHPMTWKVLTNNEVPEIPEPPTPTPTPG